MEFEPVAGKCTVDVRVKSVFLERMTGVSLEMLYLDREPGALPPYLYNDAGNIIRRITVKSCEGNCSCRLVFQDPDLDEIYYDSAGCRRGSKYANNPLYFRGRGCSK